MAEAEAVQSGASAAADMMCSAPDEGGRGKKKRLLLPARENVMEVNAKSPSRSHYPLLIPLIECVPVIAEQR